MTVLTNAMEIVETMIKAIEDVAYYTEAGRMEDLSYDCLTVIKAIESDIEEEVHSDNTNVKNLMALTSKLVDYTEACEYFKAATIEEDKKKEEETTMTEQTVVVEGKDYYDVMAEVNEDNLQAALADEGMVSGELTTDTTEEETIMTEQAIVEVAVEEVKPSTQEAALLELQAALELRHVELNTKFEDTLAKAKEEAATGSMATADIYRSMLELLEQQLTELEAKLTKVSKQLTKLRVAKAAAAPVIAVVVATKAVVKVVKVVAHAVSTVAKFIVRLGKAGVASVRRLVSKRAGVVTAARTTGSTVKANAKATVAARTAATKVVFARTVAKLKAGRVRAAAIARAGVAKVQAVYGRVANRVLAASIVMVALGHKVGTVLNNVSSATHTVVSNTIANVKGFRFRKATVVA